MAYSKNIEHVGYCDLCGKPGVKLAMQVVNDRWYVYVASYWHSGWSVVDVTCPERPRYVRWLEGPDNTGTDQVQVANGLMITSLTPATPPFDELIRNPAGQPPQEGLIIWDVSDPEDPRQISTWRTGGGGCHRSYYDGGRHVHVSCIPEGFNSFIYGTLDISDPEAPKLAGRWWWPGQNVAGGEVFCEEDLVRQSTGSPSELMSSSIFLHQAYVQDSRAYCGWARGGMVILDVEDIGNPQLVSRLSFYPPLGSSLCAHSVIPIESRGLAIVNSEALKEGFGEPPGFVAVVDIRDEREPVLVSLFPVPEPPDGYGWSDFALRKARFGPHNQHQPQNQACLQGVDDLVFMTYFSAGLQIFDISNPHLPRIHAYFVPDDPEMRIGPTPPELAPQFEDILVDRRGYIYVVERNSGMHVLRLTKGPDSRRRIELGDLCAKA